MVLLGLVNSVVGSYLLSRLNPTINFQVGDIANIPVVIPSYEVKIKIESLTLENIELAKEESKYWEENNEFISFFNLKNDTNNSLDEYLNKIKTNNISYINKLYENEKLINSIFCTLYSIENNTELTNHLTINLYGLWKSNINGISINHNELLNNIINNLLSYSIGCIFGRYSLDKPALILANQEETLQDYLKQVSSPSFMPDEDNIIPILEGEWFSDDVVGRFNEFLKVSFGSEHFEENIKYIEDNLSKDIRKYFVKDFYNDHIKRYKKRPIYWMFASPKGHFKSLIYMHRYTPDLGSKLLNDYLRPFINKLEAQKNNQTSISISEAASSRDKVLASKRITEIEAMLKDVREYEKTLFSFAAKQINIDLDDGVKVNYQKFKEVLVPIKGLEKEEE